MDVFNVLRGSIPVELCEMRFFVLVPVCLEMINNVKRN